MMIRASLAFSILFVVACGPATRDNPGDDNPGDDTAPDASNCVASAATETSCNNGFDEDCDGFLDCQDIDCINHTDEGCPTTDCGEATHTEPEPLALPDDGTGTNYYENTMTISGFSAGLTLTEVIHD